MCRNHTFNRTVLAVLFCILGLADATVLWAAPTEVERLEKAMYRYYSTDSIEQFSETVRQLKAASLQAGDEHTFYKAWGNQAIYMFNRNNHHEGLKTAQELYDYAKWHDNKFGLYTATYVMGTILTGLRQNDEAQRHFQETVIYQHRYFPKESAAAPYLALARIEFNRKSFDHVIDYAHLAMREPNVSLLHQLSAASYEYMALARKNIHPDAKQKERMDRIYRQREELKERLGHDDSFGKHIAIYQCLVNGQDEEALRLAQLFPTPLARLEMVTYVYKCMGQYEKALESQTLYMQAIDSANTVEQKQISVNDANSISVARISNEAEGLRNLNFYLRWGLVVIIALSAFVYVMRHRRQLQKQKALYSQLETATQVKNRFLNNISHEMRTPLNSINGFTEILTMPGMELPQEEKDDLHQRIKESSKTLTDIVDKMLELAYYDGMETLKRSDRITINDFCRTLIASYEKDVLPSIKLRFVSLISDTQTLLTDQTSLERVLRHVLDNAVHFTTEGSITLSVSATTGGMFQLSVSDTGPGIPLDLQHRVFERFSETGGEVKTTGTGLSISGTICRLLGGSISIDPSYTQGCRVIIKLKS